MQRTNEYLMRVYGRSGGDCHICHRRVAFINYGRVGRRGAWEIEHSVPKAKGGTDRLSNLLPAHINCNRSKGTMTTRSVRRRHGITCAPLSFERREQIHMRNMFVGATFGAVVGYSIAEAFDLTENQKLFAAVAGAVLLVLVVNNAK